MVLFSLQCCFYKCKKINLCSHLQVVVRPAVSDLTVRVPGSQLTSEEDVDLFATMKHRLVLNLTLNGEYSNIKDSLNHTDGGDFSSEFSDNISNINEVENHASKMANQEENQVSSQNESLRVCVEGNREPSPQGRVNPTWRPPTSQGPVHNLVDNGKEVINTD